MLKNKKSKELEKIMKTYYKEIDKLKSDYEDLTNELIKRISERRLKELKKDF